MRGLITVAVTILLLNWSTPARSSDQYGDIDPLWILWHETAVVEELRLTPTQREAYRRTLDSLDLQFFPLRNRPKSEGDSGMAKILADGQKQVKSILKPGQQKRLAQMLLWRIGITGLFRDEVAARMRFTESQRKRIKEIIDETQVGVTELQKKLSDGESRDELEKEFTKLKTEEQTSIIKLLKNEQRTVWKDMLGPQFDTTKLGQALFKAPELIDSGEWINSSPLALEKLRGKVVIVHFYACGCINCIHNYPTYHEWSDRFRDQEVVMIGIHTPETSTERDSAHVRQKAEQEKFRFPVLIDVKSDNWNAWGNSMWPCVYLIDKQGYMRFFWPGELKWKGSDGDKYMQKQIERLLTEPATGAKSGDPN